MIYLDYNATTPLSAEAFAAMEPYLRAHFGNPSSIHRAGRAARAAIDESRDALAEMLAAKASEIVFTGGGTEADNLGVIGLARAHAGRGKEVVSCVTEHHAVLHALDYLEKREGFHAKRLRVNSAGLIDLDELSDSINDKTAVVSIMSVNNETGVRQPVEEISRICRAKGVVYHSDLVQSFGKLETDLSLFDAASFAAHKFYGPKGAGFLWVRSGLALERLQYGGSHENERRAGTENVAGIAGMAAAARFALANLPEEQRRQEALRDALREGILRLRPDAIEPGGEAPRIYNTLNLMFPGNDSESLLMNLDLSGICASSGSACMVGSVMASHVLLAMGASPSLARGAIRFSIGKMTSEEEIRSALGVLPAIFERLKAA